MIAKKYKVLNKKNLEAAIENLADISDLSGSDSDDDPCYANSVDSIPISYLNQPDDSIIEQRLEEIFGTEDDYETVETEPIVHTTESLLSVLNHQSDSDNTTNTGGIAQSVDFNFDQDTYNSQLQVQEKDTENQGSPEAVYLEIPKDDSSNSPLLEPVISNSPLLEAEATTAVLDNYFLDNNLINDFLEDDQQESRAHNVVLRDRSQPREWKNQDLAHDIPPFEKRFEPRTRDTHKTTPLNVFERFFPDKVILIIVEQTNRYARQKNSHNWIPVTDQDIKAYLGILIMMGLNPLPDMELYWSTDPFYYNKEIAQVFPIVRFKKITENLHLNDNATEPPRGSSAYDKLYKVRPLLTELNNVYQNEAHNSAVQSIDECMVKFKGRSSLKQYMPKKPVKRGFKIWARCDAKTGYLYQFQVYTGKGDSTENEGLGYNVVMTLCNNVPRNTLLAFDNFFTSCNLLEDLYEKNIYAVGTVRSNRKDLPDMIKKKQPKALRLEKHDFAAVTAEPITAIKWCDTKEVAVLSTAHQPRDVMFVKRTQKDGSRKEILCPKAIASYTLSMGGVDLFDHFRSSYPINRKSRKFWMRLLFFLFDASIINAFITYTYTHVATLHAHRDFRLRLARSLIDNYTTRKTEAQKGTVFKNKKGGIFGVPDEIRLLNVGIHLPEGISTYKRCRFCSTKRQEQRTKIQCTTCKVALCAKNCFKTFHTCPSQ